MIKNEYKIEKSIPLEPRGDGQSKFPFSSMEINDSFLIPKSDYQGDSTLRQKLVNKIASFNARNNKDYKISIRKCVEGMRVWRIK